MIYELEHIKGTGKTVFKDTAQKRIKENLLLLN